VSKLKRIRETYSRIHGDQSQWFLGLVCSMDERKGVNDEGGAKKKCRGGRLK